MKNKPTTISTEKLQPNDYNPNQMSEDEFAEFVKEIRHLGRLPKPIVVRPSGNDEFVIIDGEHAWKAAQEAGLTELSCEVIDVSDFEAMRQTYKRNQHGTHNKVMLGRMFQRMAKEQNLSLRKLAKEIEVSDGTIRNAFEYTKAIKVRNSYADKIKNEDVEAKIAGLSLRQIRMYNRLPKTIGNLWLDSGAEILCLFKAIWRGKVTEKGVEKARKNGYYDENNHSCSEADYLRLEYEKIEKTGLLKYTKTIWYTSEGFVSAIKKVQDWLGWENKYFWRYDGGVRGFNREEFRKYACYYYEGDWPFGRDVRWIEYALNMIMKPGAEDSPACFRITPEKFGEVVKQMNEYTQNTREGLSPDMFEEYFNLAIYEKTGEKGSIHTDVREQMMEAKIEKEAPDYIRESKLAVTYDKYALWKTAEEMQEENPEDKLIIEQIAHELAKIEYLSHVKGCVMAKSDRKWETRLGKDVKLIEKQWMVRSLISEYLFKAREEVHRDSAANIELAMEIADLFYKREEQKDAHKAMSVKLAELKNTELIAIHKEILYCQSVRTMKEAFSQVS